MTRAASRPAPVIRIIGGSVQRDPDHIPLYMSAAEVGKLLGISGRTVLRWASRDASVPAVRLGDRTIRFERRAVLTWIASHQQRSRRGAR